MLRPIVVALANKEQGIGLAFEPGDDVSSREMIGSRRRVSRSKDKLLMEVFERDAFIQWVSVVLTGCDDVHGLRWASGSCDWCCESVALRFRMTFGYTGMSLQICIRRDHQRYRADNIVPFKQNNLNDFLVPFLYRQVPQIPCRFLKTSLYLSHHLVLSLRSTASFHKPPTIDS